MGADPGTVAAASSLCCRRIRAGGGETEAAGSAGSPTWSPGADHAHGSPPPVSWRRSRGARRRPRLHTWRAERGAGGPAPQGGGCTGGRCRRRRPPPPRSRSPRRRPAVGAAPERGGRRSVLVVVQEEIRAAPAGQTSSRLCFATAHCSSTTADARCSSKAVPCSFVLLRAPSARCFSTVAGANSTVPCCSASRSVRRERRRRGEGGWNCSR